MLKVQIHGGVNPGARWINPADIQWLDERDAAGWGAAVNPSSEGVSVSPTATPGNRTLIGMPDGPLAVAHSAVEIIRAMGLTHAWATEADIIVAEEAP